MKNIFKCSIVALIVFVFLQTQLFGKEEVMKKPGKKEIKNVVKKEIKKEIKKEVKNEVNIDLNEDLNNEIGPKGLKSEKVLSSQEVANIYQEFDYKSHSYTAKEFVLAAQKPNTVILDLRDKQEYINGHLKNAIHFGADASEEQLKKVIPNKDTIILTYCSNSLQPTRMISLTYTVIPQIFRLGYKNVYELQTIFTPEDQTEFNKLPWEGRKF